MRLSPWKVATYAILVLLGLLAATPNLLTRDQLDRLPDWLPKQQVTLGLDLRGGSQLLLEIDSGNTTLSLPSLSVKRNPTTFASSARASSR